MEDAGVTGVLCAPWMRPGADDGAAPRAAVERFADTVIANCDEQPLERGADLQPRRPVRGGRRRRSRPGALVAGDGRLTYRELDERANRLAHHLATSASGPATTSAIYACNRAEWVEAMLGCYKARAVPINVNYRYVEDELRYLFDNADAGRARLRAGVRRRRVAAVRADLPGAAALRRASTTAPACDDGRPRSRLRGRARRRVARRADSAPRSADDLYILYTGGTTGMPKGVMWRHEDIFFAAMGGGGLRAAAPLEPRPRRSPSEPADGAARACLVPRR